MGEAQGKKVDPSTVAAQAIEAQPAFGQIKPLRGRVVRAPSGTLGRSLGGHRFTWARSTAFQAQRKETLAHRKDAVEPTNSANANALSQLSYVGSRM
jgi:hypothetical protein